MVAGSSPKLRSQKQAPAPACYGPVVRATAVYLMVAQRLPVAPTSALLSQVCGAPVSTGWLAGLSAEAASGLGPFLAELRAQLAAEDVLHADYWARYSRTSHFCSLPRGESRAPHLGQVAYLVLRQVEPDAILDVFHGAYRNGHLLLAP